MSGSIPSELGNLASLKRLYLHSNQLSGAIPPALGDLTSLERLYLYENQLSGTIPPALVDLTSLTWLQLQTNQLSGVIPPEVSNLANLEWLNLAANKLDGAIPAQLGNLTGLNGLELHENQLEGEIPSELGNLQNLRTLDLHGNRLTGSIPSALGNLSNLGSLNLSLNALTGDVPPEVVNLTQLNEGTATDLSFNGLTAPSVAVQGFLETVDPDWVETQTTAPTKLRLEADTPTGATVTWTPIPYMGDGGHYEISIARDLDGPYTVHGTTADKKTSTYQLTDLAPDRTYYVIVRTYTPLHDPQQNALWSAYSVAVSAQESIYLPLVRR